MIKLYLESPEPSNNCILLSSKLFSIILRPLSVDIVSFARKEIFAAKKIASENEKNKNLLQGYKKVIEDLSIKLRKNS